MTLYGDINLKLKINDVKTEEDQIELSKQIIKFYTEFSDKFLINDSRNMALLSLTYVLFDLCAYKLAESPETRAATQVIQQSLNELNEYMASQGEKPLPDIMRSIKINLNTIALLKLLKMDIEAMELSNSFINFERDVEDSDPGELKVN